MTMVRQRTMRAVLAVLAAGALAACGGGGDDGQGVASLGGDAESTDDGASRSGSEMSAAEREDAMLEFAQCMRDHGVDMPDPVMSEGGSGMVVAGRTGDSGSRSGETPMDEEAFKEADEACGHIARDAFGEPEPMSPEEEAEMRDQMLEFAQCMRDHGIDMPDPEISEGRVSVRVGGGGGPDAHDADDFEAAQEACGEDGGVRFGPAGGAG